MLASLPMVLSVTPPSPAATNAPPGPSANDMIAKRRGDFPTSRLAIGLATIATALAIAPALAAPVPTTTSLSLPPTIQYGQPVPLSASVLFAVPPAVPGSFEGTVTFMAGGVAIPECTALTLSATSATVGAVTCEATSLAVGAHAVTAAYSGSPQYLASTSSTVVLLVQVAPLNFRLNDFVYDHGVLVTSEPVTLPPSAGPIAISVKGGLYSVGCSAYTNVPGTAAGGATICLRFVTTMQYVEPSRMTVTIGGVDMEFSVPFFGFASADTPPQVVALGMGHSIVQRFGTSLAFGDNTAGRLGIGTGDMSTSIPTPVVGGGPMVAAGLEHSLGAFGGVNTWGLHTEGQLGLGNTTLPGGYCEVPGEVGTLPGGTFNCTRFGQSIENFDDVVSIAAGWRHSLALKGDGTVWAWGSGYWGQNGASTVRWVPTQVALPRVATRIAAGYMHSLALLDDGTVWAWGSSRFGELGPAATSPDFINPAPRQVTGLSGIVAIAAGGAYSLALKNDGSLWTWGSNVYHTLGRPAGLFDAMPAVAGSGIKSITAGYSFAFAKRSDDTFVGWGLNHKGQVTGTPQASPQNCGLGGTRSCTSGPVPALANMTWVYAGGAHAIGLNAYTGQLVMLGDNSAGQLAKPVGDYTARFTQETYDPDTILNPAGTNGSPVGVGLPGTAGSTSLSTIGAGIDFGSVAVGSQSDAQVLTLTNLKTGESVTITSIEATGNGLSSDFASATDCPASLAVATTCTITVHFNPSQAGSTSGQLRIVTQAYLNPLELLLSGRGLTPVQVPGPPTGASAASGPAQVIVSFSPPASDGGSAITGYAATCTPVAAGAAGSASGPASPITVGNLTAGATYACVVRAINAVGESAPSAPSNSVTAGKRSQTLAFTSSAPTNATVAGPAYPVSATATSGLAVTLAIDAAAGAVCTINGATVSFLAAGTCVVVASQAGDATYLAATTVTQAFTVSTNPAPPRLANISTRMQVRTGDNVLIGGFIIGGVEAKTVVVRARGPSLAPFGITNFLVNPVLQLFSGQTVIASNDDFGTAPNLAALQASGFAPSNAQEAAILTTLGPGAYTAIVSGAGDTTGVGIIEVFEVDRPDVPLANIATRGAVFTGNDVMIGGFVIQGDAPQTVVVRARGPSLAAAGVSGVLANPLLQLFSGATQVAVNDNWQTAANAAEIQSRGLAPSNALESALLITLNPGAYTAIVSGAGGGTGVAIIEVFAQ